MLSVFSRFLSRKGTYKQVSLGIEIAPQGVALAIVDTSKPSLPVIQACEYKPCAAGEWGAVLKEFCKDHGVKQAKTHVAFHPEFYNLMLIDAPDVPDEELREAVKWRVKDFVSGAIEDFVVDAFRLPEDAYRGRMEMIYAAYIKADAVVNTVALCEGLDLQLEAIGVTELAMASLVKDEEDLKDLGVALLHLNEKKGQIDLMENGNLYLTRGIDVGWSMLTAGESQGGLSLDNSSQFDSLALDIQRSLDYYESQLGKQGVSYLFIVSEHPLSEEDCASLSDKLPVKVEVFDVGRFVQCDDKALGQVDRCSVAVGSTLGGVNVAT